MENHHNDSHHSDEHKPVSFTVPFIMAAVFIFIMVLLLSVCDPKHGHQGECECKEDCSKECMDKCEKGDHSGHDEHGNEIKGADASHHEAPTEEHQVAPDTVSTVHDVAPKDEAPQHH